MPIFYSPFAIPLIAILGFFAWKIIASLSCTARGIVRHRNEVELKQSMVDRGMSADEIERVLAATAVGHNERAC